MEHVLKFWVKVDNKSKSDKLKFWLKVLKTVYMNL